MRKSGRHARPTRQPRRHASHNRHHACHWSTNCCRSPRAASSLCRCRPCRGLCRNPRRCLRHRGRQRSPSHRRDCPQCCAPGCPRSSHRSRRPCCPPLRGPAYSFRQEGRAPRDRPPTPLWRARHPAPARPPARSRPLSLDSGALLRPPDCSSCCDVLSLTLPPAAQPPSGASWHRRRPHAAPALCRCVRSRAYGTYSAASPPPTGDAPDQTHKQSSLLPIDPQTSPELLPQDAPNSSPKARSARGPGGAAPRSQRRDTHHVACNTSAVGGVKDFRASGRKALRIRSPQDQCISITPRSSMSVPRCLPKWPKVAQTRTTLGPLRVKFGGIPANGRIWSCSGQIELVPNLTATWSLLVDSGQVLVEAGEKLAKVVQCVFEFGVDPGPDLAVVCRSRPKICAGVHV